MKEWNPLDPNTPFLMSINNNALNANFTTLFWWFLYNLLWLTTIGRLFYKLWAMRVSSSWIFISLFGKTPKHVEICRVCLRLVQEALLSQYPSLNLIDETNVLTRFPDFFSRSKCFRRSNTCLLWQSTENHANWHFNAPQKSQPRHLVFFYSERLCP